MNKKLNYSMIIFGILFIVLTIMLMIVDRKVNYMTGTKIGLYSLNNFFYYTNDKTYFIILSDCLLMFSILIIFIIGLKGLYELFKYKDFKKINYKIIIFIIFIFILFILWFIFDKVIIINYRPILINNKLESSYPSTHVLLVSFVYLSVYSFIDFNSKYKKIKKYFYFIVLVCILIISICRVCSGMHWFTDVIGSVLLSLFLNFCYRKIINIYDVKKI